MDKAVGPAAAVGALRLGLFDRPRQSTIDVRGDDVRLMADWTETFYGNILENMADGVMTLDRAGRIKVFNQAASNLLGIAADELIGQNFGPAFIASPGFDEFSDLVLDAVYNARITQSASLDLEIDGRLRSLVVNTTFLPSDDRGSESAGVIVVMTDVTEARKRQHAERLFGQYVDPRVVGRLLNLDEGLESLQERRVMTVMFSDIVGFTGLAEQLEAARLVDLLNTYFDAMTDPVRSHGGLIDKFIGDSVMSLWGGPFDDATEPPEVRACAAALEQKRAMALVRDWAEGQGIRRPSGDGLDVKIGIATGPMVVGTFGPEGNRSFTVIGDTVNVAARLEKAAKQFGSGIAVSDSTYRKAGGRFQFGPAVESQLAGRDQAEHSHELIGPDDSAPGSGAG